MRPYPAYKETVSEFLFPKNSMKAYYFMNHCLYTVEFGICNASF